MRRYLVLVLAAVAFMTPAAHAQLLVEDFDFTGLLTDNGWTNHSGVAEFIDTTTGLTYSGYWGSGIGNAANLDNNGEDAHRTFTTVSSGSVYVSFLMKADALSAGYFLHLGPNPIGTAFRGRVWQTSDGTGDYELGLSFGGNTIQATTNLDMSFGTTYLVVLKYEVIAGTTNDEVSLWVFSSGVPGTEPAPTLGPVTETTGDISPASVALRQYNAGQNFTIDGIRVGTSWATSTLPVELDVFSLD